MANIFFGVNLIPYQNPPEGASGVINSGEDILNLGNSNNYWNIFASKINGSDVTGGIATASDINSARVQIVRLTSGE